MMNRRSQFGISLVEIMIALALSVVLTGGVLQVFSSSKQSYRMQTGLSRLQSNGRFAMNFITHDIRNADYSGCLSAGINQVTNNLNAAGANYVAANHGFVAGASGANGATNANSALDASDTLTLSGAFGSGVFLTAPFGPGSADDLETSASHGLSQGDIALVSDCEQGDIFQVTGGDSDTVEHDGATNPGNVTTNLSKVYRDDAQIYRLKSIFYAISTPANREPVLVRAEEDVDGDGDMDANDGVELAEGVENLQILYGEDSTGDGNPDYYVTADQVVNMDLVVSIRVSLLLRTDQDNVASQPTAFTYNGGTTTPADRRLRRVFTSTIALRNRLS